MATLHFTALTGEMWYVDRWYMLCPSVRSSVRPSVRLSVRPPPFPYRCFYPYWSRVLLSTLCRIFFYLNPGQIRRMEALILVVSTGNLVVTGNPQNFQGRVHFCEVNIWWSWYFWKKLRLYPSFCLTFPNTENFSFYSETIGLVPSEHIFVEFQFIQEWGNFFQQLFMSRAHNPY